MSPYITDHWFTIMSHNVQQNKSVTFCDCVLTAFSHFTLLFMWPPVKKWRHSTSKRKFRTFKTRLLFATLIMLCTHMKKYKVQLGVYKKVTFCECFGKNRKNHNLILQFLLIVRSVVEQNQFFWCFIEHEYMLHWYRKNIWTVQGKNGTCHKLLILRN